jgi:hypothetical protein
MRLRIGSLFSTAAIRRHVNLALIMAYATAASLALAGVILAGVISTILESVSWNFMCGVVRNGHISSNETFA